MPRRIQVHAQSAETFGERLARLRKAAGYTQRELGTEIGISQRMVAYYEGETDQPPTTLLPLIARALGVTADELLGLRKLSARRPADGRLWRRVRQIEKLPVRERRHVLHLLDAIIEREQLKKKVPA